MRFFRFQNEQIRLHRQEAKGCNEAVAFLSARQDFRFPGFRVPSLHAEGLSAYFHGGIYGLVAADIDQKYQSPSAFNYPFVRIDVRRFPAGLIPHLKRRCSDFIHLRLQRGQRSVETFGLVESSRLLKIRRPWWQVEAVGSSQRLHRIPGRNALDQSGRRADADQFAPVGDKDLQKIKRAPPDGKQLRQDDDSVRDFAHRKPIPVHPAVPGEEQFVPVVEIAVDGEHGVADLRLPLVIRDKLFSTVRVHPTRNVASVEERPRRADGMNHQNLGGAFSLNKHETEPGDIVVEHLVLVPPRLLVVIGRRNIPLGRAVQGVMVQMLAEQIDAQSQLPLHHPLDVFKIHPPAHAAAGLREDSGFSELPGHAGDLLLAHGVHEPHGQMIRTRNLHWFVRRHRSGVKRHLSHQRLRPGYVSGERQTVCFAPRADLSHIGFGKQGQHRVPEIVACFLKSGDPVEQPRQRIHEVGARLLPETFRQFERPRKQTVGWLVRENAGNFRAEFIAEHVQIVLVRQVYESPDGFLTHHIYIAMDFVVEMENNGVFVEGVGLLLARKTPQIFEGIAAAFCGESSYGGLSPLENIGRFLHTEEGLTRKFLTGLGDAFVCAAAWEAVLVVQPGVHPHLFRFINTRVHACHPAFAQVLGDQARPAVHEESGQARPFHLPHLSAKLLRIQIPVPGKKRNPAIEKPVLSCFVKFLFQCIHRNLRWVQIPFQNRLRSGVVRILHNLPPRSVLYCSQFLGLQ